MELTEAHLRSLQANGMKMEPPPSADAATVSAKTWNSEIDPDPVWRDPANRLSRYKSTVVSNMASLYRQGPEGIAVLRRDELLFRGWHDPIMKNGTPPSDDVDFWKAKEQYFSEQWRRIEAERRKERMPVSNMFGPKADRIRAWIPEPPQPAADHGRLGVPALKKRMTTQATDLVQGPRQKPRPIRSKKHSLHDRPDANATASKRRNLDCPPVRQARKLKHKAMGPGESRLPSTQSRTLRSTAYAVTKTSAGRQPTKKIADGRISKQQTQGVRRSLRIAAQKGGETARPP